MDLQPEKKVPIPVLELKENQENQIRLKAKNFSLVLSIKMVSVEDFNLKLENDIANNSSLLLG